MKTDGDVKIAGVFDARSIKQTLADLKRAIFGTFSASDTKALEKSISQTEGKIKRFEKKIEDTKDKLDDLMSSDTPPKSVQNMEKQLQSLEKELQKADVDFQKLTTEQEGLAGQQVPGLTIEQSLNAEQLARFQELDRLIIENGEHTDELQKKIAALKAKLAEIKGNPALSEEAKRYQRQIDRTTEAVDRLKREQAELESQMPATGQKTSAAFDGAKKSVTDFGKRITSLVKSALIFSVITKALTVLRDAFGGALMQNEQFANSVAQIKGNLLTAFMPIYQTVLPALQALMDMLAKVTSYIAAFVSLLTGKSISASQQAAKALYNQASAAKAAGSASKKAAKDAEKSALSFDELNTISNPQETDAGGMAESGGGGVENSSKSPSFSIDETIVSKMSGVLDSIKILLSSASLALGAILFFTGASRLLGLGLMAVGAVGLAAEIKDNWMSQNSKISESLFNITTIVSGAMLAIGAILALTGANTGLGIALLAIGAATLATSIGTGWNALDGKLQESITRLLIIISASLLVLGAILAFSGANVPLGVGLMLAGLGVYASAVALNWNSIKQWFADGWAKIETWWNETVVTWWNEDIKPWFGKEKWIELWNNVKQWFVDGWTAIKEWWNNSAIGKWFDEHVKPWFTQEKWIELWTSTKEWFSTGWGDIVTWWKEHALITWFDEEVAPWFTWEQWTGLFSDLKQWFTDGFNPIKTWLKDETFSKWFAKDGIIGQWFTKEKWKENFNNFKEAMTGGFKYAFDAAASVVERILNLIIEKINSISFDVPEWVPGIGGSHVGFNLQPIDIPPLARGAVLPPNREFLAVLGDQKYGRNLEAPEGLIRQIVSEELAKGGYSGNQEISINFTGNLAQLARLLKPQLDKESTRKGVKLVKGGAY